MLAIQGTERVKKIIGRLPSGELIKVDGLMAARKHMLNETGWREIIKVKQLFAFVSSPQIYQQEKMREIVKGWCHSFRDDSCLPDVPKMLLPESDFMDERMLVFEENTKKYDYFYFTINAKAGLRHKGLLVFLDILPTLCRYNLKGLVIAYFPNVAKREKFTVKLSSSQRDNLKKYRDFLTYYWGYLNRRQMNDMMTSCRFGLFPNTVDNSPRLISESLIRNVPVLMNREIHGGWHYVTDTTGCFFDAEKDMSSSIDFIMSGKFYPRDYFRQHFGFEKSSRKLAGFINTLFGYEFTHLYFRDFKKYLGQIND